MASTLRILHISDLHERAAFDGMPKGRDALLRHDREERGVLLGESLQEALQKLSSPRVDLVCMTGDIADFGRPEEYQRATERIEKILKACGDVPKERFFAVPGNHDVQRKVAEDAYRALRDWSLRAQDGRALGRWIRGIGEVPLGAAPSWLDDVLRRTEAFCNWLESFRGEDLRRAADEGLGYRKTLPAGTVDHLEVPIHLVGLDSAWLCGGDDDQGKIYVTEPQVSRLIRNGEAPLDGVRICLMHHPLDHLADQAEVRGLLMDEGVDLLLHGHQHRLVALDVLEDQARLRILAAGCLVEGDWGKKWPNGFQLIELDVASMAVDVQLRKWSGRFWAVGSDIYRNAPDGRLHLDPITRRPQPKPSADPKTSATWNELLDALLRMSPAQFVLLVARVDLNRNELSPATVPLAMRATELVDRIGQEGEDGRCRLEAAIRAVAPHLLRERRT